MVLGNVNCSNACACGHHMGERLPIWLPPLTAITHPAAQETSSTAPLRGRPGGCQAARRDGRGIAAPACGVALLPPAQLAVSCSPDTQCRWEDGDRTCCQSSCAWLQGWLACRAGRAGGCTQPLPAHAVQGWQHAGLTSQHLVLRQLLGRTHRHEAQCRQRRLCRGHVSGDGQLASPELQQVSRYQQSSLGAVATTCMAAAPFRPGVHVCLGLEQGQCSQSGCWLRCTMCRVYAAPCAHICQTAQLVVSEPLFLTTSCKKP